MGETTETKLKLENEVLSLKREHKHALENLERVKSDTLDIIKAKDKATKELNERGEELLRVINEISTEKLTWIDDKSRQLGELKEKNTEADKILARKDELDLQEAKIKGIEENIVKVRNENRQLELKLERDNTALDVKKRAIEDEKDKLEQEKKDFAVVKQDFKNKLKELVKIYG